MQKIPMQIYEEIVKQELNAWQKKMQRRPGLVDRISKKMQTKVNSWIPEKVHKTITDIIRQMVKAVLFGAEFTTGSHSSHSSLEVKEAAISERIKFYRNTAAVEGGLTGAGGILLGLADFPLLLGIKLKLLFDIANLYGFDVRDYKERVFILHIFQLAFSSQQQTREVYKTISNWEEYAKKLPEDINKFEWRAFQQEYRDYIDLAKLAQLIPVIGAAVGLVVNYRLIKKLGVTAMNSYRMRLEM
ncbi:MAG: EcsC family protein [Chitinophagaceae bacterium]